MDSVPSSAACVPCPSLLHVMPAYILANSAWCYFCYSRKVCGSIDEGRSRRWHGAIFRLPAASYKPTANAGVSNTLPLHDCHSLASPAWNPPSLAGWHNAPPPSWKIFTDEAAVAATSSFENNTEPGAEKALYPCSQSLSLCFATKTLPRSSAKWTTRRRQVVVAFQKFTSQRKDANGVFLD